MARKAVLLAATGLVLSTSLIAAPRDPLLERSGQVVPQVVGLARDAAKLDAGPGAGDLEGPLLRPGPHPPRHAAQPPVRPFAAEGPLQARLTDAALRPRARPAGALFRPRVRPGDLLLPDPPRTLAGASDLLCLAVAIYHEARDQSLDGQLAVASVILNRAREPRRWGADPCEVVVPGQFSFLSSEGRYPPIDNRDSWAIAVEMAREALERGPSSLVGRADHYHTPAVRPDWRAGMERVIRIGDHIFYADAPARG